VFDFLRNKDDVSWASSLFVLPADGAGGADGEADAPQTMPTRLTLLSGELGDGGAAVGSPPTRLGSAPGGRHSSGNERQAADDDEDDEDDDDDDEVDDGHLDERHLEYAPVPPPPDLIESPLFEREHSEPLKKSRIDSDPATIHNDVYIVSFQADASTFAVTERSTALVQEFQTNFVAVYDAQDPQLTDVKDKVRDPYFVADGGALYWKKYKSTNILAVGSQHAFVSTAVRCTSRACELDFNPEAQYGTLTATMHLPPGVGFPQISWRFKANKEGYWSIGFVGAPSIPISDALRLPQPANTRKGGDGSYQGGGYPPTNPDQSVWLPECGANLPYAMVSTANSTNVLLLVNAEQIPFGYCNTSKGQHCPHQQCRPGSDPTHCQNRHWCSDSISSFGMRKEPALASPSIFSPNFGGYRSHLNNGSTSGFSFSIIVSQGAWHQAFRKAATQGYNFTDVRDQSGTGSINKALERMTDYLANADGHNFLQWDAMQKFSNYWMDQCNAFKPLDPLSPLATAMLTDDIKLFTSVASEIVKFSMRTAQPTRYITPYTGFGQGAFNQIHLWVGDTFLKAADLAALHIVSNGHTPAFLLYAREKGMSKTNDTTHPCPSVHASDLLIYADAARAGSAEQAFWLECAQAQYDRIAQSGLELGNAPLEDLLQIYERTKNQTFLRAATEVGRALEQGFKLHPVAPPQDIVVDTGNRSYVYWWTLGRWNDWGWPLVRKGVYAREQTVPSWRSSRIGMQVQTGGGSWLGTVSDNSPSPLMRLAAFTNDSFTRSVVRASIVGRFSHFAGDFSGEPMHTLPWEASDFADHPLPCQSQTTWNTGHFFQFAGTVTDFIVTDTLDRSAGEISFPGVLYRQVGSRWMYPPTRPGRWYDELNVTAWLPNGLFAAVSNEQISWMAGHRKGNSSSESVLFICLLSQSRVPETVTVKFNSMLAPFHGKTYVSSYWVGNEKLSDREVGDTITTTVAPKGIAAFAIRGVEAQTRLHHLMADPSAPEVSPSSRVVANEPGGLGRSVAFVLSWGKELAEAFFVVSANSTEWKSTTHQPGFDHVTLHYALRGEWEAERTITLLHFPFDFSVAIPDDSSIKQISYYFNGSSAGKTVVSSRRSLPVFV
jgi:hypothetical protein